MGRRSAERVTLLLLLTVASEGGTINVWPLPANVATHPDAGRLSVQQDLQLSVASAVGHHANNRTSVSINTSMEKLGVLERALVRYKYILRRMGESMDEHGAARRLLVAPTTLQALEVSVQLAEADTPLGLEMDESYTLTIQAPRATLTAPSVWGALRGLETFSQLVESAATGGGLTVSPTVITDSPRFPYRGVLVDSARHFLPVSTLMTVLDAMAYSKLNVLHWHLVDDDSFPYISKALPKLSNAAFSPLHTYNRQEVKEIVAYARDRGIRVMPEFDTPGHTKAWGIGYPEIMTECFNPLPGSVEHGVVTGLGVINPALNQTYELISKLWAELAEVFPDKYMHLGGDEVDQECWNSNEGVRAFMAAHKLSNADALQKYHGKRMIELTKAHGRQAVVWQEMFDSNALELDSPDTVVHVWKGGWKEELQRVTAKGFRALVSTSWYLNLNEYGNKWKEYYKFDPTDWVGTPEQKKLVLGGEGCMWGEFVDATNIIPMLWPRVAAVAERLWSPETVVSESDAQRRLHIFRCKLLTRGINAWPLGKGTFCDAPWDTVEPSGGFWTHMVGGRRGLHRRPQTK